MECIFCKKQLKEEKYFCEYCHFLNADDADLSETDREKLIEMHRSTERYQSSPAYHDEILSKITNISIWTFQYGWDEKEGKFKQIGEPVDQVIVKNGMDCNDRIAWGNMEFGQDSSDELTEKDIDISYQFDGKTRNETFPVMPVRCGNFWDIGVKIDKDYCMTLYLGRPDDNKAESMPKMLDVK